MKIQLPETIASACCRIAKVQCRGATSSDRLALNHEAFKHAHRIFDFLAHIIWKSCEQKGSSKGRYFRHTNRFAVQPRATSPARTEHLVTPWIVNGAGLDNAVTFKRDGNGKEGILVGKVS